ncbi:ankyrin repeat protein [Moumouvirus australiensis]|uniref:Ankyrin repeat protein n=1 Tax=Moumouvirus australiensis TaxID=2109587 RepID=A0A2P1EMM2_9VIRU|nr:ankyrin repeat protein [Moumouvirus australiensis]AVL95155.1 ankyrin repeat protein [Moumouvirus australiensis]
MMQNISEYNYETSYSCSYYTSSSHFTKLMYLIITERNYPDGHQKIINYLENNKNLREINHKNEEGWTALMIACRNSNIWSSIETVKLLLKFGADVNLQEKEDGWTALMLASTHSNDDSNIETVKLLLDYSSDPNIKDNNGYTILEYVSRQINRTSNLKTLLLLIDYGANNYYEIACFTFTKAQLKIYYKLLAQKTHYKMNMDYIHKTIKSHTNKILYNPNSIRSQLLFMKLVLENNSTEKCITFKNLELFDYLGIYDIDSIEIKIFDSLKYMD